MASLPKWMRAALLATAAVNVLGAAAFFPGADALRARVGMPETGHPLYVGTVGIFILSFGLAYLYAGASGRADRLFIAVAAGGKIAFSGFLVWLWTRQELAGLLAAAGLGDLGFGGLFLYWLIRCGPANPGRSSFIH